jgi:pyridoxine 5-phosphate synthase
MRRLILALDALPGLREAAAASDLDVAAAAMLAELAGVEGVRLSVCEDLKPVRPEDVLEARRAARVLELRMPPSPTLLKVALEARPDRVLLASDPPLGRPGRGASLGPTVRALAEAGIPVLARIEPEVESLKAVHAENVAGVEFDTTRLVDLPSAERAGQLERLGDAVRLASKLGLGIGLGGAIGYRNAAEVLGAAPAAEWVAVGRAAVARAVLVGLDRALRDLRTLVA